ncbi:hypothetical protein HK414_05600 [Ramlibacter terrae]|uniref:Polysaccharide chain length determinant N-terminal domain-containing protein n=1 Tax=Ramlibacter terrae TaxID=2732511 RepID=A0ABX6P2R1_9BURK|nr:hypothetical protein HK414_05600 [Ramlibacter terrae]
MSASELSRDDASGFAPTVANELALRQPHQLQLGGAVRPDEDPVGDDSLTLTDIGRIVYKHKWTLLPVIALGATVAAVRTFLSTPVYRSSVILQIEQVTPRVVQFQNDPDQNRRGDDAASIRTQQELLKSRSLAERVIDELRLDTSTSNGQAALNLSPARQLGGQDTGGAADAPSNPDYLDRIISGYQKLTHPSTRSPEVLGREGVIRQFLGSISVEPIPGSRLLTLHVDNTNPALASRIANTMVQSFIAMGMERRLEASSYAKRFLDEQIKQMKAKLEESERKLNTFAQANQILTLGENTNPINQTYTDYAAAPAKAEQDRIKAESVAAEVRRNPEATAAVTESKSVLAFKQRKAELEIEYQQNLRIYKPEFPKMQQIKAQITETDAQIKSEVQNIAAMLRAQYDSAVRQEALLREKLGAARKQVLTTQTTAST